MDSASPLPGGPCSVSLAPRPSLPATLSLPGWCRESGTVSALGLDTVAQGSALSPHPTSRPPPLGTKDAIAFAHLFLGALGLLGPESGLRGCNLYWAWPGLHRFVLEEWVVGVRGGEGNRQFTVHKAQTREARVLAKAPGNLSLGRPM